jgi:glycine cleavage system aminomethyltransferase T
MITKLHGWHLRAGARRVDFGRWDMPIQYETGPREEYVRVRAAAGLFDIDHLGRLEIEGPGAEDFLQRVQTWDVSRLAVGGFSARAPESTLAWDTWKSRGQRWVNRLASSSGKL